MRNLIFNVNKQEISVMLQILSSSRTKCFRPIGTKVDPDQLALIALKVTGGQIPPVMVFHKGDWKPATFLKMPFSNSQICTAAKMAIHDVSKQVVHELTLYKDEYTAQIMVKHMMYSFDFDSD